MVFNQPVSISWDGSKQKVVPSITVHDSVGNYWIAQDFGVMGCASIGCDTCRFLDMVLNSTLSRGGPANSAFLRRHLSTMERNRSFPIKSACSPVQVLNYMQSHKHQPS